MGKKDDIEKLTNLMCVALRHRIGSIVNQDELYSPKYAKDADSILKEAEKVVVKQNWNDHDKKIIREKLRKKLKKELIDKDFLDDKKFGIMDREIERALEEFDLV
ncbi:MAG: hypothetical protein V1740_04225 [Candidatus Woesearchaeota archaeon]